VHAVVASQLSHGGGDDASGIHYIQPQINTKRSDIAASSLISFLPFSHELGAYALHVHHCIANQWWPRWHTAAIPGESEQIHGNNNASPTGLADAMYKRGFFSLFGSRIRSPAPRLLRACDLTRLHTKSSRLITQRMAVPYYTSRIIAFPRRCWRRCCCMVYEYTGKLLDAYDVSSSCSSYLSLSLSGCGARRHHHYGGDLLPKPETSPCRLLFPRGCQCCLSSRPRAAFPHKKGSVRSRHQQRSSLSRILWGSSTAQLGSSRRSTRSIVDPGTRAGVDDP
jgi:hypothetical protein